MRPSLKLALATCLTVALGLLPATAMAGPNYEPAPPGPKGPPSGPPPHGKAFGFFCKGESKKHVKGQKGTPFSRCVKAMARAAKNGDLNPAKACKGLSKKHKKGEKGTPFSRCVKAAAKLRRRGFRTESPPLEFGPMGWGGWSCPTGTEIKAGGVKPASATVLFSGPARPGEPMYPVYPHHTFAEGETGWVVQNDNDTETITIVLICR